MSPADPQQAAVYAAEDSLIDSIGPRLRRWSEVAAFLESILVDPRYLDLFPDAPLEIAIARRSRNATRSVAIPSRQTIVIRDGSWNALTVLHELSHLIAPALAATDGGAHGPDFVATELRLVREFCGFADFGALQSAFDHHAVIRRSRPLASGIGPD